MTPAERKQQHIDGIQECWDYRLNKATTEIIYGALLTHLEKSEPELAEAIQCGLKVRTK